MRRGKLDQMLPWQRPTCSLPPSGVDPPPVAPAFSGQSLQAQGDHQVLRPGRNTEAAYPRT